MMKNVGGIDKIIRFVLGIATVLVGLFAPIAGGLRIIAFAVAAVALFTAIFGFWPLWKVLGISTYKEKKN